MAKIKPGATYQVGMLKNNSSREFPTWVKTPGSYQGTFFIDAPGGERIETFEEFFRANPYGWGSRDTLAVYELRKGEPFYVVEGTPFPRPAAGMNGGVGVQDRFVDDGSRAAAAASREIVALLRTQLDEARAEVTRKDTQLREALERAAQAEKREAEVRAEYAGYKNTIEGERRIEKLADEKLDKLERRIQKSSGGMDGVSIPGIFSGITAFINLLKDNSKPSATAAVPGQAAAGTVAVAGSTPPAAYEFAEVQ